MDSSTTVSDLSKNAFPFSLFHCFSPLRVCIYTQYFFDAVTCQNMLHDHVLIVTNFKN